MGWGCWWRMVGENDWWLKGRVRMQAEPGWRWFGWGCCSAVVGGGGVDKWLEEERGPGRARSVTVVTLIKNLR